MQAIGKVTAHRATKARTSQETRYFLRYFLLSAAVSPERFGTIARAHWGVENGLHWVLDVTMNEDGLRNLKGPWPHNLALLRRLALNLSKLEPSTDPMRGKLKRAGWDNRYLATLLDQSAKIQMR